MRRNWRPNRTATYWPPLLWPQHRFFPVFRADQPGAWRPSLSGTCSLFQHLLSKCNCSIEGLRAHSTGCWSSLPHLFSNCLNFLCTELYNSSTSSLHVDVTNRTHSTHPRSRLYSDIPRPDAPIIYTGAFPILTGRVGGLYTTNEPHCLL